MLLIKSVPGENDEDSVIPAVDIGHLRYRFFRYVSFHEHARIQKVLSEGVQLRQRTFIYLFILFYLFIYFIYLFFFFFGGGGGSFI